jgi:glucose-1-phosphate cytidylyltransferase
MKAVILAGGLGTRISEESIVKPKPMIEIGGMPIIWHIMKSYSVYGINEFIICCGYRGYMLKEYFANYFLHTSDVTIDLSNNSISVHHKKTEPWLVTLVDTGEKTQTGGRLKRVSDYVGDTFMMTYGDGLSSVDITDLVKFHGEHGRLATMTAVQPPGRFGALDIDGTKVNSFVEKPLGDRGWINGGFFVLNKKVLDLVDDDNTIWEQKPLEHLARNDQLQSYFHRQFWHPMDTLRDRNYLEELWSTGSAPWKNWI